VKSVLQAKFSGFFQKIFDKTRRFDDNTNGFVGNKCVGNRIVGLYKERIKK